MDSGEEMAVKEVHDRNSNNQTSNDTDKLSYEIFSILESKFLFGYSDPTKLFCLPKEPAAPLPPPPQPLSLQRGRVCILSIDGNPSFHGGIMASKALSYLEQSLRLKSSDPQARISDYFDLVAGTGIGGVLSTMLFSSENGFRPLFNADDTWHFLTSLWPKLLAQKTHKRRGFLWPRSRPLHSATKAMENTMKELFGEKLTLRDTLKPVLIPCYDLNTSAPFVFSRADAIETESYNFRLWEVGRATWAEPGQFEPGEARSIDGKTICFGIDGGLVMSNPAGVAITHVLHNKQEFPFVRGVEDVLVVSLGCGSGGWGEVAGADWKRWGRKEWARPVARIAADGAADFVDHAVAMAFGKHRADNYVRIQVRLNCLFCCVFISIHLFSFKVCIACIHGVSSGNAQVCLHPFFPGNGSEIGQNFVLFIDN